MTQSRKWKVLEKQVADILGGERVERFNYGKSDVDVKLPKFPHLKLDTKNYKKFRHFALWKTVKEKYCKEKGDIPVLITRETRARDILVTIPIEFFKELLEKYEI
jgi:hypothetical protein